MKQYTVFNEESVDFGEFDSFGEAEDRARGLAVEYDTEEFYVVGKIFVATGKNK